VAKHTHRFGAQNLGRNLAQQGFSVGQNLASLLQVFENKQII
jgi:hypothetical protein